MSRGRNPVPRLMRVFVALSLAVVVTAAVLPSVSADYGWTADQAPACRDYLHIPTGLVYECLSSVAAPVLGPLPGVGQDVLSERFIENRAYAQGDYMPFSDRTCGYDVCIDANVGLIGPHCVEIIGTETSWDAAGTQVGEYEWKMGPFCNADDGPLTYLKLFGFFVPAHGCKIQVETQIHLDGNAFGDESAATFDGC